MPALEQTKSKYSGVSVADDTPTDDKSRYTGVSVVDYVPMDMSEPEPLFSLPPTDPKLIAERARNVLRLSQLTGISPALVERNYQAMSGNLAHLEATFKESQKTSISEWKPGVWERISRYFYTPPPPGGFDRSDQPLRTLGKLGAVGVAETVSGLGLTAPDILAKHFTGKNTLGEAVAEALGIELTPTEKAQASLPKFMASLHTTGALTAPMIAKLPARAAFRYILGGTAQFATRQAAAEAVERITQDKPIDWSEINKQGLWGVLFGGIQAGAARVGRWLQFREFVKARPEFSDPKKFPPKLIKKVFETGNAWQDGMSQKNIMKVYGKDINEFARLIEQNFGGGVVAQPPAVKTPKTPYPQEVKNMMARYNDGIMTARGRGDWEAVEAMKVMEQMELSNLEKRAQTEAGKKPELPAGKGEGAAKAITPEEVAPAAPEGAEVKPAVKKAEVPVEQPAGPPIGSREGGFVDLTPIAEAGKQAEIMAGKIKQGTTRFVDLEPPVRKALIEYEEQLKELPKVIAKESVEKYGALTEAQERIIENHRENPKKYPDLPEELKPYLEQYEADIAQSGKILEDLGYPADWANSYRDRLQKLLIKENSRKEPDFEKISALEDAIDEAEDLRYLHHHYKKAGLSKRMSSYFKKSVSKRPSGLLGREIPTYEKAEELGLERTPLAVTRAHMMFSAQRAQIADALIQAVNGNENLSLPESKAPEDWVYLDDRMFPESVKRQMWVSEEGKPKAGRVRRKYAPPIAKAIEEVTYARTPNALVRWYDNTNHALKIIGFYNPLIMTKNDMFQGWRAAGVKYFAYLPKAVKIYTKKGPEYEKLRKGGLFNNVSSWTQPIDKVSQDLLDTVRNSFGEQAAKKASEWLNPLRLFKTMQEFNNATTWQMDEIARIATYGAIKDTAQTKGMTDFEVIELANDFMANYGKVPRKTKAALTKAFFVPTYRISNMRVAFGRMFKEPWRYKGPLLRTWGWKSFVYFGLPAVVGAAIKWYTGKERENIRTERGYRLVVPNPETGKDTVFALSDPLLEGAKLTQRPIRHTLQVNLAPIPSLISRILRGPKFKGSDDPYGEFFKLGTPIYRDVLNMRDKDKSTANKIMSQFGVAYTYSRTMREPDKETATRALAKAMSIWTDWKMQKMDLDRMMGKPVDISSAIDASNDMDWIVANSHEPHKVIKKYNARIEKILEGVSQEDFDKYHDWLVYDLDKKLENKAVSLGTLELEDAARDRTIKFLKNFDITPRKFEQLLEAHADRPKKKDERGPAARRLEGHPVLGPSRRKKRAIERFKDAK